MSRIAEDPNVLVIGSQSILGSYSENELPPEATGSMEVDTAFFSDPTRPSQVPAPPAVIERVRNWVDDMSARQRLKGS